MHIELDPLTLSRLEDHLAGKPGVFKIFYDTEDCGCNGVLAIQIVDEPLATDIRFQEEPYPFVCDRQQESLFDDVMRLQAEENYPSFKVSSDSTLFGSNVRVTDKRQ
ncbi:iron-sulfur cluster biosynthesis family protein [Paenibacillus sp. NFR01]|uniref:iron-sulfur cluster biosynthesis family protein n=1 Tax=Paenibacillus sp. NFR01 TaxID=1566279 RepID=UPI0008C98BC7|nr:iron-sulfur cluster biosynthesis family protein [Paenibacillus sp. NFR01]SET19684.1 Uncharacterized protein YqkB [Paenibacillus sp. NFR01]